MHGRSWQVGRSASKHVISNNVKQEGGQIFGEMMFRGGCARLQGGGGIVWGFVCYSAAQAPIGSPGFHSMWLVFSPVALVMGFL